DAVVATGFGLVHLALADHLAVAGDEVEEEAPVLGGLLAEVAGVATVLAHRLDAVGAAGLVCVALAAQDHFAIGGLEREIELAVATGAAYEFSSHQIVSSCGMFGSCRFQASRIRQTMPSQEAGSTAGGSSDAGTPVGASKPSQPAMTPRAWSTPRRAVAEKVCALARSPTMVFSSRRTCARVLDCAPRPSLSALVSRTWQGRPRAAAKPIMLRSKSFSGWRQSITTTSPYSDWRSRK